MTQANSKPTIIIIRETSLKFNRVFCSNWNSSQWSAPMRQGPPNRLNQKLFWLPIFVRRNSICFVRKMQCAGVFNAPDHPFRTPTHKFYLKVELILLLGKYIYLSPNKAFFLPTKSIQRIKMNNHCLQSLWLCQTFYQRKRLTFWFGYFPFQMQICRQVHCWTNKKHWLILVLIEVDVTGSTPYFQIFSFVSRSNYPLCNLSLENSMNIPHSCLSNGRTLPSKLKIQSIYFYCYRFNMDCNGPILRSECIDVVEYPTNLLPEINIWFNR